ncbi:MAG: HAMP domain-containing sensor histidine kinase [Opitutus sp.]
MTEHLHDQLTRVALHLKSRREAILQAARVAAERDPEQTTVNSLTRVQFNDHLPPVLEAFECKLRSRPGSLRAESADAQRSMEEVKHGLHRWQQGYRLRELLHEWGHLHHCVYNELEAYATSHPDIDRETVAEVNRQLISLVNEAISESTAQYARVQQDEAAGHLRDLQRAVAQMKDLERRRAELIHQAVHDLRGNVQSVSSAAEVLREAGMPEVERLLFVDMLQQGAEAVGSMMGSLMDLARLEAGQEKREIARLEVVGLVAEFCNVTQSVARARGLYLNLEAPAKLTVEGDGVKVRRILQNLVLNAIKYTDRGGVTVSIGEEGADRWWLKIKDTGPGLLGGPGSPLAGDLKEATDTARESDPNAPAGESTNVLPEPVPSVTRLPVRQQAGEGIGLSIVKRLCELLDASLELASSATSGTTFRVVLPRSYALPPSPPEPQNWRRPGGVEL